MTDLKTDNVSILLQHVKDEWKKDSVIDYTNLDGEVLRISELHSKYYNIYLRILDKKRKEEKKYKQLVALKKKYYLGLLDKKELEELGWQPCQIKYTMTNMQHQLDSDNEICDSKISLEELETISDFIKSIVTSFGNRGYNIKTAVDYIKWKGGQ